MKNKKDIVKKILIPLLLGVIVGIIINPSMNKFELLNKPVLEPPKILFPIVWTILYILMGISNYLTRNNKKANKIYNIQLFFNYMWSILFFPLQLRFLSFIWIIILMYLVIKMIKIFYKENKVSAYLQIPYLIWIIFATYLNIAIYLLN